jgi:hypothetical protein
VYQTRRAWKVSADLNLFRFVSVQKLNPELIHFVNPNT